MRSSMRKRKREGPSRRVGGGACWVQAGVWGEGVGLSAGTSLVGRGESEVRGRTCAGEAIWELGTVYSWYGGQGERLKGFTSLGRERWSNVIFEEEASGRVKLK